jgi:glycosyltransferase involved in cell wall biosynthesis
MSENKPKVTVAIAMYHVENYIKECVESVLKQDFVNLEIVICDDCSPDNSASIIKSIAQKEIEEGKLRIIKHKENKGIAQVRNTCIDAAMGEYIFFLDGDDYLAPTAISTLYNKMMEEHADIVMGKYQKFHVNDGKEVFRDINKCKSGYLIGEFVVAKWMQESNTNYWPVQLWNKLYNVEWLRTHHIRCTPSHLTHEDNYFSLQVALIEKSIITVDDVTLFWRMRSGSATHRSANDSLYKEFLSIYDDSYNKLLEYKKQGVKIPTNLFMFFLLHIHVNFTFRVLNSNLLSCKKKTAYLEHISTLTSIKKPTKTKMLGKLLILV